MEKETKMPMQILELIERSNFNQLSDIDRKSVLEHISESEYEELREAYHNGRSYFDEDVEPSAHVQSNLSRAFAEKHNKPTSVLKYRIEIWKIAAVLIPLLFAGLWTLNYRMSAQQIAGIVVHDTIVVQQKIKEVQHILDTVIAWKEPAVKKTIHQPSATNIIASNNIQDTNLRQVQQMLDIGIRTLQPEDLNRSLVPKNGKSMDEDELLKHFSFAGI
ncbi:MAG: hypothetical protein V4561_08555 [Bacteroidota bacterium]